MKKIQKTKSNIQALTSKKQNKRQKVQGTRYKVQGTRYKEQEIQIAASLLRCERRVKPKLMAPEQLRIQQAGIADLPKIIEIYNSTIPGRMVTADLFPVTVEERLDWFHAHSPGKYPLLVVFNEKEMVGWISFQPFYGRPAYDFTAELSIYLDHKYRGHGYGSYLLAEAINLGIALHFKTLLGFIFGHNEPSLKLFYKSGFEKYASLPKIAVLDGIERDLLILGKRIAK